MRALSQTCTDHKVNLCKSTSISFLTFLVVIKRFEEGLKYIACTKMFLKFHSDTHGLLLEELGRYVKGNVSQERRILGSLRSLWYMFTCVLGM